MKTDNDMPREVQHLARLVRHHSDNGSKEDVQCFQAAGQDNWALTTPGSPAEAARLARCLLGYEVSIEKDDSYARISGHANDIYVIRCGLPAVAGMS